ncbi:MAG: EpsG family protein [Muribaculaceae bacterium]|nr:EpsG family protein [Muribaculaceae bacterium]
MDALLYFPTFLAIVSALAIFMAMRLLIAGDGDTLATANNSANIWIALAIALVFTLWLGGRPYDVTCFGDTLSYAHMYNNYAPDTYSMSFSGEWFFAWIMAFCNIMGMDVNGFFTVVAAVYTLTALLAVRIILPRNPLMGMVFVWGSLMYFTFCVNGMRNGMACHIILLAMALFLESRYFPAAFLAFLAMGIHRSTALPIASLIAARWVIKDARWAVYIWLGSIVVSLFAGGFFVNLITSLGFDERMESYASSDYNDQFSATGFRWDFLLYSAFPILMGYVVLIKKNLVDNWYRVIFVTYCLANAFWVLVIRMAFTNRFAYLSWFMYPLVLAYPLIMMKVWPDQDRRTAYILLAYVGFTVFMNGFYW